MNRWNVYRYKTMNIEVNYHRCTDNLYRNKNSYKNKYIIWDKNQLINQDRGSFHKAKSICQTYWCLT